MISSPYPRRLLHALLSALIPGAGQVVAGRRRRGFVMLAAVVALLAATVVVGLRGADEVLAWVIQPPVLLALLGVNVVLLAFRLYAVIDAYLARARGSEDLPAEDAERRTERHRRSRRGAAAGGIALAILVLLTVAPHGIAGYYTYLSHDLLTGVFADEEDAGPVSTAAPSTTEAPSTTATWPPTTSSSPTTAGTSTSRSTTTTEATTTTTTEASLQWGENERLTILLIGTDAGYGRRGARADSIMVATVNLQTGSVALFGIPRNTGELPLGEKTAQALGRELYPDMISNLYDEASVHSELAPEGGDPGAIALRETVSLLLGIQIHHYGVVDMGGFVDLVDAFGGVKLNVKERVWVRLSPPTPDEEYRIYDIRPGIQELDGLEALAFARSRTGASDYDRMRRQRCVIMGLLYQNGVADLALAYPRVVKAFRDSLITDIPIDRLADLIRVRGKVNTDETLTVGFMPPEYITGRNELGYNILDRELVQATVRDYLENPEQILDEQAADAEPGASDCWKVD